MKKERTRLDALMAQRGLTASRQKAQALIMAGKVLVDGEIVDKAGKDVGPESVITLKEGNPFVSRAGVKLAGFLDSLSVDVAGITAVDVGASTGGFTDCLLKRGARKVYAIDVGKGLIDVSLRNDPRVVMMEECNIRHLDPNDIGESADLAVVDVSFISLEKVLERIASLVRDGGHLIALIKPQFEVGKGQVGKGGIVKDPLLHEEVVCRIKDFALSLGLVTLAVEESTLKGTKGNLEFLIYLEVRRRAPILEAY